MPKLGILPTSMRCSVELHVESYLNAGDRLWCWSRRVELSATGEYHDALETGPISSILVSFLGERVDLEYLDLLDLACPAIVFEYKYFVTLTQFAHA